MTVDQLRAAVEAALTGDPDDLVDLLADDVVLIEQPGEPAVEGPDAVMRHFLAYGGRREVARVPDCFLVDDRGGLAYSVWFRADAHAFGQHARVLLTLVGGLITRWDGAWVELESDLSPWGGD